VVSFGVDFAALRRRREDEFCLSEAQVAELSGLTTARIVEIEEGLGTLTLTELSRLGVALAFDPSKALAEVDAEFQSDARRVARFKASQDGSLGLEPLDVRRMARAAELSRIGAFLWRGLGRSPGAAMGAREAKAIRVPDGRVFREGYSLGQQARYHLAPTPREPLPSVQATFETLGIHVALIDFDTRGVLAASLFEPGGLPMILLNRRAERVRERILRRSILAHELCHLLHDGSQKTDLVTLITRSKATDDPEQRANAFAPNFLAPGDWVRKGTGDPRAVVLRLAESWGMTFSGATWHAKNLRWINSHEADALQRESVEVRHEVDFETDPDRLAWADVDIAGPGELATGLVSDLAVEAAERAVISAGRCREILRFR